jgi:hypothetical protein
VHKAKRPSSDAVDDGPLLISGIPKSSAALLRCKHQARNGHAKGEKNQSHLPFSTYDDCFTVHYGYRSNPAYRYLKSLSAVQRRCQSKLLLWCIGFFDSRLEGPRKYLRGISCRSVVPPSRRLSGGRPARRVEGETLVTADKACPQRNRRDARATKQGPSFEPRYPRLTIAMCPGNMLGKNLSHYRLIEQIGAGGMGVVFLAEHQKSGSGRGSAPRLGNRTPVGLP